MIPTDKSSTLSNPFFEPDAGLQVDDDLLARIRTAMAGMKFGQISIAIHDGHVVQVDRIQQVRLFRKNEQNSRTATKD